MTSANVFNLNSVKQGQVLNANAAKGRSKAENPDAAGVFASLMGSNYSTNFNMPSVNTKINNNVLQQTNAARVMLSGRWPNNWVFRKIL